MRATNPFVGAAPLTEEQPIHGRERELNELGNLLISRRIVLLHSPSGAGKSSLLSGKGGLLDRMGRGQRGEDALLEVWPVTRVNHERVVDISGNRFVWS